MKIKVDVDTKTFIRFLLVATGFVAVVFLFWRLWPALMILGISAFLALAFNAPVSALSRRLPGQSRVLATAISYTIVLTIVGLFIYIALPPIIDETNKFIAALPQYVENLSQQRGVVADFINKYGLQEQLNQIVSGAQSQFSSLAQGFGNSIISGVSSVLTGFITLVTVLVVTFLMLIEGPAWLERLWGLYEDKKKLERHQQLASKMNRVITSYVNGQVLVATIAGLAGLTVLLVLASLFPQVATTAVIPLTGLIFVTDLIPMIGATIGAAIVVTVLLFSDVGAAVAFLVYFVIYLQIENNFIQPMVQSRTVALSALSIFVAVILGISLLGLVGGIVAIPIAGCLRVVLIDFLEHRRNRKVVPEKRGLWSRLVAKAQAAND